VATADMRAGEVIASIPQLGRGWSCCPPTPSPSPWPPGWPPSPPSSSGNMPRCAYPPASHPGFQKLYQGTPHPLPLLFLSPQGGTTRCAPPLPLHPGVLGGLQWTWIPPPLPWMPIPWVPLCPGIPSACLCGSAGACVGVVGVPGVPPAVDPHPMGGALGAPRVRRGAARGHGAAHARHSGALKGAVGEAADRKRWPRPPGPTSPGPCPWSTRTPTPSPTSQSTLCALCALPLPVPLALLTPTPTPLFVSQCSLLHEPV